MGKSENRKKKETSSSYKKEALFFFVKFFVLMGFLLFLELLNPVSQKVIVPFTNLLARSSVFLLGLLGTKTNVSGTLIVSPQFAADIKAGCTGIEPIIILLSAIFANSGCPMDGGLQRSLYVPGGMLRKWYLPVPSAFSRNVASSLPTSVTS